MTYYPTAFVPAGTATSTLETVTAGQSGSITGYDNYPTYDYGSIAGGPLLSTGATLLAITRQVNASIFVITVFFAGNQVNALNDNFRKMTFDGDDYLFSDANAPNYIAGGSPPYTVIEWVFFGGSYTGTVMVDGLNYDFQLGI
jgi:hypothetical protein